MTDSLIRSPPIGNGFAPSRQFLLPFRRRKVQTRFRSLPVGPVEFTEFSSALVNHALGPENPSGPFEPQTNYDGITRRQLTEVIRLAPERMRDAVQGLDDPQLDTHYRNWTIRQIVHHLADSHVHSYIRCKWTLTEEKPTIKAYEEANWVALPDSARGDIRPALAMLSGVHEKWVQLLDTMTEGQFQRAFVHPQSGETITLWNAVNYYAWHCRHHTAQVRWLRDRHHWGET